MKKFKFVIIGGDKRLKYLSELLAEKNHTVLNYSEWDGQQAIFIGPVPCTRDGTNFFSDNTDEKINIDSFLEKASELESPLLLAGAVSDSMKQKAKQHGIRLVDVMESDEVAIKNAIPTAEGAIKIAIENSDITLMNSKCLVIGYGRCGKVLANMLNGMGANVTATHRRGGALIEAFGCSALDINRLPHCISQYDFIFNTVPTMLITDDVLECVKKDAVIIDISSAPGGVDFEKAKEKNIKALLSLGLPGKIAPKSAALALLEEVIKICEE